MGIGKKVIIYINNNNKAQYGTFYYKTPNVQFR